MIDLYSLLHPSYIPWKPEKLWQSGWLSTFNGWNNELQVLIINPSWIFSPLAAAVHFQPKHWLFAMTWCPRPETQQRIVLCGQDCEWWFGNLVFGVGHHHLLMNWAFMSYYSSMLIQKWWPSSLKDQQCGGLQCLIVTHRFPASPWFIMFHHTRYIICGLAVLAYTRVWCTYPKQDVHLDCFEAPSGFEFNAYETTTGHTGAKDAMNCHDSKKCHVLDCLGPTGHSPRDATSEVFFHHGSMGSAEITTSPTTSSNTSEAVQRCCRTWPGRSGRNGGTVGGDGPNSSGLWNMFLLPRYAQKKEHSIALQYSTVHYILWMDVDGCEILHHLGWWTTYQLVQFFSMHRAYVYFFIYRPRCIYNGMGQRVRDSCSGYCDYEWCFLPFSNVGWRKIYSVWFVFERLELFPLLSDLYSCWNLGLPYCTIYYILQKKYVLPFLVAVRHRDVKKLSKMILGWNAWPFHPKKLLAIVCCEIAVLEWLVLLVLNGATGWFWMIITMWIIPPFPTKLQ